MLVDCLAHIELNSLHKVSYIFAGRIQYSCKV